MGFLSTPSARRATEALLSICHVQDISIHALREEGDKIDKAKEDLQKISIHALREEGDTEPTFNRRPRKPFLSTPSARRATKEPGTSWAATRISIHALREEGDFEIELYGIMAISFLSTPSARRATWKRIWRKKSLTHFYPRPPRGGRR